MTSSGRYDGDTKICCGNNQLHGLYHMLELLIGQKAWLSTDIPTGDLGIRLSLAVTMQEAAQVA